VVDPVPARRRVAAYVVRERDGRSELLVFDHVGRPQAGTQVPGGGTEDGEEESVAVLREVMEETGLTALRAESALGTVEAVSPLTGRLRRTTFWHVSVTREAPDRWNHVVSSKGEDDGLVFSCRFSALPLALTETLADGQDAFLPMLLEALRIPFP
jgi:8-oxo-dGTP pyrophosphatase MutT (NUDIX family)